MAILSGIRRNEPNQFFGFSTVDRRLNKSVNKNQSKATRIKSLARLAAILGAVALFLPAASHAQSDSDASARAQVVFTSGMQALDAGDLQEATLAFERVLRLDPNANNIRVLLGTLYLEAGNSRQAEFHLAQALERGGIPEDALPQVEGMLAQARSTQDRTVTRGSATIGMRYSTNANGGPDDVTTFTSGTAEEDLSLEFRTNYGIDHVLDRATGRSFRTDLSLSFKEFTKDASPTSQFAGILAGPVWPIGPNAALHTKVIASVERLRGDPYRTRLGLGADYNRTMNDADRLAASVQFVDETFSSAGSSTDPERDGVLSSFRTTYERQFTETRLGFFGLSFDLKDARQNYNAFNAVFLSAGMNWRIADPFQVGSGKDMSTGVDLSFGRTTYDSPDLVNSTTDVREDDRITVGAFASYPVSDRTALGARLEWTNNASNYASEDHDNLSLFVGLTYTFGG